MTTRRRFESNQVLPWILLPLYVACCALYCAEPWWRPDWDGGVYLLAAKSLAEGDGYAYLGKPFFLRPPGLSFLLSFFLREDGFDFAAINMTLLACAGLAMVSIYLLLRPLHGRWIALAVALLGGTCPVYTLFFNFTFAEFPYLVLFFLALVLYQASLSSRSRWGLFSLLGGVSMAAAFYLRTAAIVVLPAVLALSLWRSEGKRRLSGLLLCAVVGLLALPWFRYSREAAAEAIIPVEQEIQLDYTTALLHENPRDPGSPLVSGETLLRRARAHGGLLLEELVLAVFHQEGGPLVLEVLLLLLVLSGVAICLKRGHLVLEWLTAASCLVILLYNAYGSRLLVPLAPLVYLYLLVSLSAAGGAAARRFGKPWLGKTLPSVVFAALFLCNLPSFAGHMAVTREPDPQYRELGEWLEQNTPKDAVLLCNQAPILSLLSGRRAYTYRFPNSADLLDTYDPDFVVLDGPHPEGLLSQVTARTSRYRLVPLASGAQIPVYALDRFR